MRAANKSLERNDCGSRRRGPTGEGACGNHAFLTAKADAVVVNTPLSDTADPATVANAFKPGVKAGRMAYLQALVHNAHRLKFRALRPVSCWRSK